MKRTKRNKTVSAILTADWHLREDTPVCRTDDFQEAQWKKVKDIATMQKAYDCPVFHAGDLFNHWKPSPWLLSKTIKHLPDQFWTIFGNHDLPQHNLELTDKCGIYTLAQAGKLQILPEVHWGQQPSKGSLAFFGRKTLIWHVMNYQGKKPWPGCTDPTSAKLLRKYPKYDLILTGHNHKTFTEEHEGRVLVNPGSLMRQETDQINHRPTVFLWYASDNTIEPVLLDYMDGVISREHIEIQEKRDERIDAFISKLDGDWEAAMNFEENLERFYQTNSIRQSVQEIITKAIEL